MTSTSSSSAGRRINSVTRDDIFQLFREAKTKEDVIHVLTKNQHLVKKIPLPCPSVTIEQAKKDFRRERVLLNDVPYIPDQLDVSRSNGFAKSLSMLIDRIKNRGHINCTEAEEDVADLIMRRACRTSAGADAFFTVQRLLCVDGTFVTQKTSGHDPPIRIDVFISSNCEDLFHNAEGSSQWIHTHNTHGQRPFSEVILRSESGSLLDGHTRPFSMSSVSEAAPPILSQSSGTALAHIAHGSAVGVVLDDPENRLQLPPPLRGSSGISSSSSNVTTESSSLSVGSLESDRSSGHDVLLMLTDPSPAEGPNDSTTATTANTTESPARGLPPPPTAAVRPHNGVHSFSEGHHNVNGPSLFGQHEPSSHHNYVNNDGRVLCAVSMDTGESHGYVNVRSKHSNSEAPPLHSKLSQSSSPTPSGHRNTIFSWDSKTSQQSLQSRLNSAAVAMSGLYDHSSISRELCCRVEMRNAFAIYDVSAMDVLCGDPNVDPPAWIDLEAVLVDESNFKTGENYRRLELHILSPKLAKKTTKSGIRNPFSPLHGSGSGSGKREKEAVSLFATASVSGHGTLAMSSTSSSASSPHTPPRATCST
jgi:hypothetical protein